MHAQLHAEGRDAVVVQLALVEHDVVEEADGVAPLEQLDGDRPVRRREVPSPRARARARALGCGVTLTTTILSCVYRHAVPPGPSDTSDRDGALVRGAVAPVERPHDLADAGGGRALAAGAPGAGVGDAEHVLARLADGVEGVARGEGDAPPRGRVRDAHGVVAEDHLRRRDPEVPLQRLDRPGPGDGQLAARDGEGALAVRLRRRGQVRGARPGLRRRCDGVYGRPLARWRGRHVGEVGMARYGCVCWVCCVSFGRIRERLGAIVSRWSA